MEWKGQLYIVKPDGKIIPIPGWPVWIDEPIVICCVDFDIVVKNLDSNQTVNLTKRFDELKKD